LLPWLRISADGELEPVGTTSDWTPTEAWEAPICGVTLQAVSASATGRIKIMERQSGVDTVRGTVCIMAEPYKSNWQRVCL
jgi:hypothetical protein